jgi:hypothetical protein
MDWRVIGMEALFRVASQVSSPLAYGGLVAMMFFLILKQIVAKNIFPSLTRAVGGDLLKLIIQRLFILALVAMILGFIGFIFTTAMSAADKTRGQNSINVTLQDGMTFKEAAEFLADLEHFTVDVSATCDQSALNANVRGGQIRGKSTVELIELLRLRLKDSGTRLNYRVTKAQDRGVYEITCN